MANEMSEKDLRNELLKNDFTAPTSWNKSRLKKELDKILSDKESNESGEKATDESSESEEKTTDVKVRVKIAFSNERLKINAKEGDTLELTTDIAKYLVKIDRTCEYVND
jgi:hypothetical protein